MRKVIDFMKGHPVITGIIGVTIGVAATKVLEMDTMGKVAFLRIILTMAMSMFVYGDRNCFAMFSDFVFCRMRKKKQTT